MIHASVFERLRDDAWRIYKFFSPYRTGNMCNNAINAEHVISQRSQQFTLYIDLNVAYYAPFTNEKWVSPRWNGRKNPNEGWVDAAVADILRYLAGATGGTYQLANTTIKQEKD